MGESHSLACTSTQAGVLLVPEMLYGQELHPWKGQTSREMASAAPNANKGPDKVSGGHWQPLAWTREWKRAEEKKSMWKTCAFFKAMGVSRRWLTPHGSHRGASDGRNHRHPFCPPGKTAQDSSSLFLAKLAFKNSTFVL